MAETGVPTTRADWLAVKGVGEYTAAAVASVCFDERTPVVDGNVIRVLSRLRGIDLPVKAGPTVKLYWRLASELVDQSNERPGDFNQAIMELGATICVKSSTPKCEACPWQSQCALVQRDLDPLRYPPPAPKAETKKVDLSVCVALRASDGALALVRLPKERSLLAHDGMWHLPTLDGPVFSADALAAACRLPAFDHRVAPVAPDPLAHSITSTRYKIYVHVALVPDSHVLASGGLHDDVAWVPQADLSARGSSSLVAKALAQLQKQAGAHGLKACAAVILGTSTDDRAAAEEEPPPRRGGNPRRHK